MFGPTASGKSAVAEATAARLETEVVSVDALQVYRGLPILTNQPSLGTRLVGIRSLDEQMTVGEFAPLAHAEIDQLVAARGAAVVTGGTGLYLRAALTDLELPPAVDESTLARVEQAVDEDADVAHGRLAERDPAAAAAVHPNDRQRLVRALALAESGASLSRTVDRLWSAETRRPTLVVGLVVSKDELDRRIQERAQHMFESGVVDEVRAALDQPLSRTVEKTLGLREIASLDPDEAFEACRHPDGALRALPGEVDAADPRHRPAGRRARAGDDRGRHRRARPSGAGHHRLASSAMLFEKWHALGNAYVLVAQPDAGNLTPDRVRRLCDPSTGIGSDGVVEILTHGTGRAEIAIWNPDGSSAEMSGNGTRIAAAWLLRDGGLSVVEVEATGRRIRSATAAGGLVRQEIGEAVVGEDEALDLAGERIPFIPVDVGNPHAVVRRDALSRDELLRIGPALEVHPRFPGRTNVQLASPDSRGVIRVLVWERGAGETSASGSSAVAVGAAAVTRGWCDSPVRVSMPGGELLVAVSGSAVVLTGPAEEICVGTTAL